MSSTPSKQQQPATVTSSTSSSSSSMSTNMQMGIFLVMLGASAGFTLYTKKTSSMLQQMQKVKKFRRFPTKYGPMTKAEWDKIKPLQTTTKNNDDDDDDNDWKS